MKHVKCRIRFFRFTFSKLRRSATEFDIFHYPSLLQRQVAEQLNVYTATINVYPLAR